MVYVTWALLIYPICTPSALRPAALEPQGVRIRQTTHAHATYTKYSYIATFKEITLYCWLSWTEKQCSQFYFIYRTIHLSISWAVATNLFSTA